MKQLVDFLPVVLFFVVFKSYDDVKQGIMAGTAVLIVATLVQLAWSYHRYRKIEKLPLITAILAVVFGGVTLLLQDEIYIKWKPTVVNWLFGAVFLGSHLIGEKTIIERMMSAAMTLPRAVWSRLNLAWGLFFIAAGCANLFVAFHFDTDTWVNFKLFGMLGLTLVFVILQSLYIARHMSHQDPPEQAEEP